MTLPLRFPYPVMESRSATELPLGTGWQYEPKWDGFRCLAFKDGSKVQLQSKAAKQLTRYFPEVEAALAKIGASRCVLDGELVITKGNQLNFDSLLQRIHPAASRIRRLSQETPATLIVFDILVDERGRKVADFPLRERRKELEKFAKKYLHGVPFKLSPATPQLKKARSWIAKSGSSLDGLIAKRLDKPYLSGEREGMEKIKFMKTADCVVGGFRYASKGNVVGSLLLGLYDSKGLLHHVGFVSTGGTLKTKEFTAKLEKLIKAPGFTGQAPGGPSRWSTERSAEWKPLQPKLVVEVQYDHLTGGRFRHGTKFLRWRKDKTAKLCTMKQVEQESGSILIKS